MAGQVRQPDGMQWRPAEQIRASRWQAVWPEPEQKFTPADGAIDWTRIETLVHGPGASDVLGSIRGGDANSAVFACLMALAIGSCEPPLRVYQRDRQGKAETRPEHPWQEILDRPTPRGELSPELLWFWTNWAKHVDGNAYWLKTRSGDAVRGNVVQLWPCSPTLIEPVTVKNSGDFISHYKLQTAPGVFEAVPVENVIHFRLGIDDRDHRRGLSPLKRLARSISTDDEADRFVDALLKNYAVPGLVVVVQDKTLSREDADKIKERVRQQFGTDNRGNVAVLNNGAAVTQFGFSPKDLDMSILHRIPEERISAVLRVPAIVAGLGAGLDRATYANFREAREMFTEQTLMPLWKFDAGTLNAQLKPDFTSDPSVFCAFDTTDVRAFQEDEDKKYVRLNLGVQGGWILPDEAREDIGRPPLPNGAGAQPRQPVPPVGQQQGQGQPDQQRQGKGLQAKAIDEDLLRRWPTLAQAMVDLARPALEADLARYFDGQHKRVRRRLIGQEGA